MFCGIVEYTSEILARDGGIFVMRSPFEEAVQLGQSIAHDGACMTVTDQGENRQGSSNTYYSFFVMEESLNKTQLGTKKTGDYLNVERCMKIGDRIDGHMVSGHIDTTAIVNELYENNDHSRILRLDIDNHHKNLMITKGSIAINGVSLTIASLEDTSSHTICTVCLIPYTWHHTNLSSLTTGSLVNIEFDMIGKYIVRSKKS